MKTPDFVRIVKNRVGSKTDGDIYQLSIDFNVGRLHDIVIQGGQFVAFYNEETHFWESRLSFYEYARKLLYEAAEEERAKFPNQTIIVMDPQHLSSKVPTKIEALCKACEAEKPVLFNQKILWAGDIPERKDYATFTMPYSIESTECPNYDAIMSVLYEPEDRTMLEWLAGCALCGEARKVDKFVYLEGEPGSGKSTFLNILAEVMGPYGAAIKAEELANASAGFATSQLKNAPLVAIQFDGDLSKIETNTTLNNIMSHEPIYINEKYTKGYYLRLDTLLFIASNYPLRLTDSLSGLLRRCLDPVPSGKLIPVEKYNQLCPAVSHELGGVAHRFIDVYRELGPRAYNGYRSSRIVRTGNALGYWVERNRDFDWSTDGECLLSSEYALYRTYCEGTATKPISKSLFERQLRFFWDTSVEELSENNYKDVRFFTYTWKQSPFVKPVFSLYNSQTISDMSIPTGNDFLVLESRSDAPLSVLCSDCPAQYANEGGTPKIYWDSVTTTLSNIVSTELHYVKLPSSHIVIDLDCRDSLGGKSKQANLDMIRKLGFPPTYAEFSKSGEGIHLHYIYDGDPTLLTNLICENVEVKVFKGNASLRRKFTFSNGLPVAHISSGIPLKEKKEDVAKAGVKDSKHLENIIKKGLRGEYGSHVVTIQFLAYIIGQCKSKNMPYDISMYKDDMMDYALASTHHSKELPSIVDSIPFKNGDEEKPIAFFDMEIFPNYNCLCWKLHGESQTNRERFPSAQTIQQLVTDYRLIGFNNKAYDNAMMYYIMQGYSPQALYRESKAIISKKKRAPKVSESLSYSDIYDFCNKKQSLKKWENEYGIHHMESRFDFDKDLPESAWDENDVYCCNDVEASEVVFDRNQDDWLTRLLLAYLTGMTPNDSTNDLTAALIFGDDMHPQEEFVYTDLSKDFPGYSYTMDNGSCKSRYLGKDIGEGGYVSVSLGYHTMVGVNDVESMHPTSAINLNIFGSRYTKRYKELVDSRKAAKNGNEDFIKTAFNGKIWAFVQMMQMSFKKLAKSLKVPINAVYGLTSAKYPNRFKDPRNVDNIVAKRGELMMMTLEDKLLKEGVVPIHIKTDSIKLASFTQELNDEVVEFGKKYGYRFTIEEFYTVFCVFNKAEYLAYNAATGAWESRGATFQNQYVFKTLLGGEIEKKDFILNMSVEKGRIYIGDTFYGKTVNVIAAKEKYGGVMTCRSEERIASVSGTKGWFFMEYEEAIAGDFMEYVDLAYYDQLVSSAKQKIEEYVPLDVMKANAHLPIPDIPCLSEINEAIRKRGGV